MLSRTPRAPETESNVVCRVQPLVGDEEVVLVGPPDSPFHVMGSTARASVRRDSSSALSAIRLACAARSFAPDATLFALRA